MNQNQHPIKAAIAMKKTTPVKPKRYVVEFSDPEKPPVLVSGWKALLRTRRQAECATSFRGFHSKEAARDYLDTLTKSFLQAQQPLESNPQKSRRRKR